MILKISKISGLLQVMQRQLPFNYNAIKTESKEKKAMNKISEMLSLASIPVVTSKCL